MLIFFSNVNMNANHSFQVSQIADEDQSGCNDNFKLALWYIQPLVSSVDISQESASS
jgi:hypothetical protein